MKTKRQSLVIILILCLLLAGCTGKTAPADAPTDQMQQEQVENIEAEVDEASETSELVLADVRMQIIEQLSITEPFLLETDALLNLYGIGSDLVRQSASFVTMSGTFPDEVILVEAISEEAAEIICDSLENRLNEVMVQSETYDPENYDAAQQCRVTKDGLYISLVLSPMQEEILSCYYSCFE